MRALRGRYLFRVSLPADWMLKAVLWNGTDVTDTGIDIDAGNDVAGIEIVATRSRRAISGTVVAKEGRPVHHYVVVAFARDDSAWGVGTRYVKAVRSNQDGTFTLDGLSAAEYLLVALEYLEPGDEGDKDLLRRLSPVAERVTGEPTSSKSVQLKLQNAW